MARLCLVCLARFCTLTTLCQAAHSRIGHIRDKGSSTPLSREPLHANHLTAAVLAQSVERVDCRAGRRGFDSWGRTNTQGLKITEK